MKDNSSFSRERAEMEVDKFLMDAEMMTAYLRFERGRESRNPQAEEENGQLITPKIVATYVAWIVGGAGFGYVRKTYIDPKFASGEWQAPHFSLPGMSDGSEQASSTVVMEATSNVDSSAVSDSVMDMASSVDSSAVVDSLVDAASNAMDLASNVVDAASNVL
jgi:hypothetical protein